MEFEDMQVLWNSEKQERLFAINETALYSWIKQKGRSVNHLLQMTEAVMIGMNLVVSIMLIIDGVRENDQGYEYLLPAFYFAFSLFALYRRFTRRKEEIQFEESMVGELDKSIWRIDYLIRQSQSMMLWYVVPMLLLFSTIMVLEAKLIWALGILLIVVPLSYFGGKWEVNKCYLPKKRELESLRQKLTAVQNE